MTINNKEMFISVNIGILIRLLYSLIIFIDAYICSWEQIVT